MIAVMVFLPQRLVIYGHYARRSNDNKTSSCHLGTRFCVMRNAERVGETYAKQIRSVELSVFCSIYAGGDPGGR